MHYVKLTWNTFKGEKPSYMLCTDNVLYIAYQMLVHVSHMFMQFNIPSQVLQLCSKLKNRSAPIAGLTIISLKYAFVIYIVNYYIKVYLVLKSPFQLFQ